MRKELEQVKQALEQGKLYEAHTLMERMIDNTARRYPQQRAVWEGLHALSFDNKTPYKALAIATMLLSGVGE